MTAKRHTGFTDAALPDGVLESDANGAVFNANKVLDAGNAGFADLTDVNIPTALVLADNGKTLQAFYQNPITYGDESDGNATIAADTIVNKYTDLTEDHLAGATILVDRDSSEFVAGKNIMVHQPM